MTTKDTIKASAALFLGFVLVDYAINTGIGARTRTVQHVFEEKGQRLGIIRETPEIGKSCYYVESLNFSNSVPEGSVLTREDNNYRIFNYRGKSDSGEQIEVNLRGFTLKDSRLENK